MWKQVYCEKCNSRYHYECEDTTKKQIMKMYSVKHNIFAKKIKKLNMKKTWIVKYNQLKEEIEKMKEEKAKVTKTVSRK